jgi:fructan beta-fructosidase
MSNPSFHFTAPQHWLNDPNGLVYLDGEWHLFFQHNPFGIDWGHMSWGHAVSRDLIHWEHLPVALPEQPGYMIFSGSAAVDWDNTGGFGDGAGPALVAAYTAHRDGNEAQHIAYSLDHGRTWTNYAGNPVIDLGLKDFRDPKIFWHAPAQRWVMATVLPDQRKVRFYGSSNLRDWTHLSDFGPAGSIGGVWECPDFFALKADPTPFPSPFAGRGDLREKWILKVDDQAGIGNASGGQYFIGDFDGVTFTCDDPPERVRPLDFGMDFYAAQSWNDAPDGRRVWLAWMSYWAYGAKTPTSPWRGMMSLPRELALRRFEDGLHLVHQPARELQALRRAHHHIADVSADEANAWLRAQDVRGTALEIEVTVSVPPPPSASLQGRAAQWGGEMGLRVRVGAAEETVIGYAPIEQQLYVDRSRAGDNSFSPRFDDRHAASVPLRDGALRLHVFVDACSVEVFADEGRVVLSELIFPSDTSDGVTVFGEGVRVQSLDVWNLDG